MTRKYDNAIRRTKDENNLAMHSVLCQTSTLERAVKKVEVLCPLVICKKVPSLTFDTVLNTPLWLQCQRGLNCLKNNDGED